MTLDKARELLSEVLIDHGQAAVDKLVKELGLDEIFGFEPGTLFDGGLDKGRQ